jgi:hypothetical protein
LGIFGSAALLAAMAAFFNFVLLGINGPVGHVMPQTQNSGQALLWRNSRQKRSTHSFLDEERRKLLVGPQDVIVEPIAQEL